MPRIADISPMLPGHPLARELVADDPEGEREDAAADALDDAGDDQHARASGERGEQRAGGEDQRASTRAARSLPYMSPSRPMIGVPTEADSR